MTHMILSGWIRLIIILSAIWLCISGYLIIDAYQHYNNEYESSLNLPRPPSTFVIDPQYKSEFYNWQPVDLLAEGKSSYVRNYKPNYHAIICFVIYPIISIWLLYFSIIWVASGFRKSSTKNTKK